VKKMLREAAGDISATEAAEQLGTSRVSARRYLEYLSEEGRVQVQLRYGSVGRPERRYVWRQGE
jgi:response regulator of citrate/malate metabolism